MKITAGPSFIVMTRCEEQCRIETCKGPERLSWLKWVFTKGKLISIFEMAEGLEAISVIADFTEGQVNIGMFFDDGKPIAGLWFIPADYVFKCRINMPS